MILQFPQPATEEGLYVVECKDWDKPCKTHTLGYAAGNPAMIRAFYDDGTRNSVDVRRVQVINITPEMVDYKRRLQAEKQQLQQRLSQLERELMEVRT